MHLPPEIVRFAPSPTGRHGLHLGGLRTALYNILLAKRTGGRALLRIDDTDAARNVPGAEETLRSDLAWAGLHFDGTSWRQSERAQAHAHAAQLLVSAGLAYRCSCAVGCGGLICSSDTASPPPAAVRLRTRLCFDLCPPPTSHGSFALTGADGHPSMGECAAMQALPSQEHASRSVSTADRPLEDGTSKVFFDDRVYGRVVSRSPDALGDAVLSRVDGTATYALASAVDDREAGITTVLRGQEWLPATPLHIAVHRALAAAVGAPPCPPRFAHLPLIRGASGRKLSKRTDSTETHTDALVRGPLECNALKRSVSTATHASHPSSSLEEFVYSQGQDPSTHCSQILGHERGAVQLTDVVPQAFVAEYRSWGIVPAALLNYVALLGWSPPHGCTDEVMDVKDMAASFSIAGVNRADAKADISRLMFFNREHIRRAPGHPDLAQTLLAATRARGLPEPEDAAACVHLFAGRVDRATAIVDIAPYLFVRPPAADCAALISPNDIESLRNFADRLSALCSWGTAAISKVIAGDKGAMRLVRAAATGTASGAPIAATLAVIGRDETLGRIRACLSHA